MASMVLQSSIGSVFGGGGSDKGRLFQVGLKFGSSLKFRPPIRVEEGLRDRIDLLTSEKRIAICPPRLCLAKKSKEDLKEVTYKVCFDVEITRKPAGMDYDFQVEQGKIHCLATKREASSGSGFFEERNQQKLCWWFPPKIVVLVALLGFLIGYLIKRT